MAGRSFASLGPSPSEFDLLGCIIPSRQTARRIRDTILSAYRERQVRTHEETRVLDAEIGELERKVFSLHESYVVEQRLTDPDLYQRMLTKYKAELAEKRIAREELEQECTDISKLLDYAFGVLLDARTLWLEADPDQRQRLQRAIFPQGVEYSPASGFGTPATSCQFDGCPRKRRLEELGCLVERFLYDTRNLCLSTSTTSKDSITG